MKSSVRKLPEAELAVMQALWSQSGPVRRAELEKVLQTSHPMAPTTLLTLLSRLAEKKFVEIRKEGRGAVYLPLVSRQDYTASCTGSLLETLCGGSLPAFAAALCDCGLSPQELEELRRLLERDAL